MEKTEVKIPQFLSTHPSVRTIQILIYGVVYKLIRNRATIVATKSQSGQYKLAYTWLVSLSLALGCRRQKNKGRTRVVLHFWGMVS